MKIVDARLLSHDSERRFLDQTGAFFSAAVEGMQKVFTTIGPPVASATWAISAFACTTIVNTAASAYSLIANTGNLNRALNVAQTEGKKFGDAAQQLADDVHETRNVCIGLAYVMGVVAIVAAAVLCRNSVCATDPNSIFCAGPSRTTMTLTALGIGAVLIACRGASGADGSSRQEEGNSQLEEASTSEQWRQSNLRTAAMHTQTETMQAQTDAILRGIAIHHSERFK